MNLQITSKEINPLSCNGWDLVNPTPITLTHISRSEGMAGPLLRSLWSNTTRRRSFSSQSHLKFVHSLSFLRAFSELLAAPSILIDSGTWLWLLMSITGRLPLWTGFSVSVEPTSRTSAPWIQSTSSASEASLFLQRYRIFQELELTVTSHFEKMVRYNIKLTKPKTFCLFFLSISVLFFCL